MLQMRPLFVVFELLVWFCATDVLGQDSFVAIKSAPQSFLCATDTPNVTTVVRSQTDCVRRCQIVGQSCKCVNYMKNTTNNCALFMFVPTSSKVEPGCKSIQRASMCNPRPTFPAPFRDEIDCSFPYTFNGSLLYSCSTKILSTTSICIPRGCLLANRTLALCGSYTGYTAAFRTIQLNVSSTPPVSVNSVFDWIVVHNRPVWSTFNYSTVNWSMASNGFGSLNNQSDFWLGLERMYQMTSSSRYRLRFELQQQSSGLWYSAEYWWFSIGTQTVNRYRVQMAGYTGDAGDAMNVVGIYNHNNMPFSTYDNKNDNGGGYNCAKQNGGPWWYNNCMYACVTCTGRNYGWFKLPTCPETYVPQCYLSSSRILMKPQ